MKVAQYYVFATSLAGALHLICTEHAYILIPTAVYMLGAKYGFVQSVECTVQTMDPYFVRAIHGLHVHLCLTLKKNFF